MVIAVEFDGTIVEDKYPGIGKEKPYASFILNKLRERGHQLILYSHRTGLELEAALNWCKENDIPVKAPHQSRLGRNLPHSNTQKMEADLFIDARNLGGLPGWMEVFWMIHPEEAEQIKLKKNLKKEPGIKKLKKLFFPGNK